MFCFKWCNDNGTNPAGKCQHTLDRIGTSYNCPSKYTLGNMSPGEFEVCDSDSFPIPGEYTVSGGATSSYAQPAESLGPITTVPYTPTSAATSNCKTYQSTDIFLAGATTSGSSSASATAGASGSGSGSSAGAAPTSGSSGSSNGTTSGNSGSGAPATLGVSMLATVAGVFAAVAIFA